MAIGPNSVRVQVIVPKKIKAVLDELVKTGHWYERSVSMVSAKILIEGLEEKSKAMKSVENRPQLWRLTHEEPKPAAGVTHRRRRK